MSNLLLGNKIALISIVSSETYADLVDYKKYITKKCLQANKIQNIQDLLFSIKFIPLPLNILFTYKTPFDEGKSYLCLRDGMKTGIMVIIHKLVNQFLNRKYNCFNLL